MRKIIVFMVFISALFLAGCSPLPEEINTAIAGFELREEATEDFNMPKKIDEVSLVYQSSNIDAVNVVDEIDGTVVKFLITRGDNDVTVTITVAFKYNGRTKIEKYQLKVPKKDENNNPGGIDFTDAFKEVDELLLDKSLSEKLALLLDSNDGYSISYKSSDINKLRFDTIGGNYFAIPASLRSDTTVTITVTIKSGSNQETKNYTVTVLKDESLPPLVTEYTKNPNHRSAATYNEQYLEDWGYTGLPTTVTSSPDAVVRPQIMVIPVAFSGQSFSTTDLDRLEEAFFGDNASTGYESVSSYYEKSSYGKVVIEGSVLDVFTASYNAAHYNDLGELAAEKAIIEAALAQYETAGINFDDYDFNNDGYIDGIYLIYSQAVDYETDETIWWAWCLQYESASNGAALEVGNKKAGFYMWAGLDFIDDPLVYYGLGDLDNVEVAINAITYIHESGHMFGLDDYYDYDDTVGPPGGLGGYDMMDYNVGDQGSFSKLMLGWVIPHIVTADTEITLKPFSTSGEVLLIPAGKWNNDYFSEYILIDLYTPTGLNEVFADGWSLFSVPGVRIYHVDAELISTNYESWIHEYDNSWAEHKLIRFIEPNGDNSIETPVYDEDGYCYYFADDDDLFQAGDKLSSYNWYNSYNSSKAINFEISIISCNANGAKVSVIFK